MELMESVYKTVDTLGYPILILENTDEVWRLSYANAILKNLTPITESQTLTEPLQSIIKHASIDAKTTQTSLHNYEIFGTLYTIYLNRIDNRLFIIFIELQLQELFKNMTLNDIDSSYNPIVVVLDTKGAIVDVNESFLQAVGKKKEEILHTSFFDSFIPGDKEKLNSYLQALHSDSAHHQHFMTPLKGKNNKLYRIKWQVSTIKKAEHSYIIAIGSDISRFVEENSELKRELTSIKIGFDFFPMAVGYMNAKGDFSTMNPKFIKLLNLPKNKEPINFQEIPLFKKHIDFKQMNEHIELIKEMHYAFEEEGKKYQVDIRMLRSSKGNSKLYIFVIQ